MQRNVVILDIDYVTYEEKPVIRLFSKDGDKNIVLIDDTFEPYLYVMSDDLDECITEIEDNLDVINIEKVQKKDFQIEKEFLKVTFKHPQELAKNRDNLRDLESVIQIREFDIPFYRRYLIDKQVTPSNIIELHGESINKSLYENIKVDDDVELFKINEEDKKYLQKKYIPELRKYINNKNYKKIENISKQKLKNIEISDTKHIDIYEMKISEEEFYSSIVDVLEIVKDDYRTLNMISQKLAIINNENENTDIEAIKNYINNVINIIRKKEYSDKDFIYVLLYKKENEIVRTELCIKNNRTIAIEARDNQIIINQYDVKSNLADVKSFNGIINIVLNNITEIIINKKINNDIYDTSINIECNFKKTTTFPDEIQIEVYVQKLSALKLTFGYIFTVNNEEVFSASSSHCFLDLKGTPIILQKAFPDFYEELKKYVRTN